MHDPDRYRGYPAIGRLRFRPRIEDGELSGHIRLCREIRVRQRDYGKKQESGWEFHPDII
jgi:hypothetical protein